MPIIGDDIKSPGRRDDRAPRAHAPLPRARRQARAHHASSTSAATPTSSTCSSASASSRRRSPRPTPSPRCSTTTWAPRTSTSARRDYVPWLTDRKWAYIRMEGRTFGDVPLNIELKLEVWDSPNSAGIVIDAVRLAKLALDNGVSGALEAPELLPDEVAAEADRRRRGARGDRGVHQAVRARKAAKASRPPSSRSCLDGVGRRRSAPRVGRTRLPDRRNGWSRIALRGEPPWCAIVGEATDSRCVVSQTARSSSGRSGMSAIALPAGSSNGTPLVRRRR